MNIYFSVNQFLWRAYLYGNIKRWKIKHSQGKKKEKEKKNIKCKIVILRHPKPYPQLSPPPLLGYHVIFPIISSTLQHTHHFFPLSYVYQSNMQRNENTIHFYVFVFPNYCTKTCWYKTSFRSWPMLQLVLYMWPGYTKLEV